VDELVDQEPGEQGADQPELEAKKEADQHRGDGGVAGLAWGDGSGQGAMMA
jgi:hypothetical protein